MPDYICWLIARRDGDGFMAGLRDGIARVWLEPELRIEYLHRPFAEGSGLRMNDAKVDSAGRIWAGSMHNTDYAQAVGTCSVSTPTTRCTRSTTTTTSAMARLQPGRRHHVPHRQLRRPHLRLSAGRRRHAGRAARVAPVGEGEGSPDGMTVDSEGCVWIAQWGGSRVCRYSPEGELLETIDVPVRNPASCTFGGADLKTLYITTAREDNTPEQLAAHPLTGAVFAVRVDVAGVPAARFG
jgi:sugar lactone lactonase YvrE